MTDPQQAKSLAEAVMPLILAGERRAIGLNAQARAALHPTDIAEYEAAAEYWYKLCGDARAGLKAAGATS